MTLTGSYNDLLDYVIFAVLLFYILTIAGLFVLRRDASRYGAAVQGDRLPGPAGDLHRRGGRDRGAAAAVQTELHLARA